MCEYQYQRRSRRPLMTMKFPSSLGSNARLTTTPVRAAASGVPQLAVMSNPLCQRPPLR